jgi:hypothetical protein
VTLCAAFVLGAVLPEPKIVLGAGLVGFLGYGVSLVLFVLALRHIGTARTGAYFSLAPFVGAGLSLLLLREQVGTRFVAAAGLMGLGIWLRLTERHEHLHYHESTTHEHRHVHDEHYRHDHEPGVDPREPHTHVHTRPAHARTPALPRHPPSTSAFASGRA